MMSRPVSFFGFTAVLLTVCTPPAVVSARHGEAAPPVASSGLSTNANNPLVRLAPADAQTLAGALRSVANQTGLAFVAEGTPFRARGSAPPLVAVAEKWPESGLPLGDAVQKIAGAYDYEAERKGDVLLLRKRYTNPNDLPEVTTEELRLALRDASRAASGLPAPTIPPDDFADANSPFMADLFHSLKPSQQPEGLRGMGFAGTVQIADLDARQKKALWQCAISRHIQAATGKSINAYKALQTLERSGTFFSKQDIERGQKKRVQVFVYTPKRSDTAVFPSFAFNGQLWENTPVPADYDASHAPLPFSEPREGANTQTLQKFCDSGGKAGRFTVDSALAAKNVLLVLPTQKVQTEDTQSLHEATFRAIGDIYGLRVLHLPGDKFHLARGRVVTAQTVSELNTTVPAAFPEPLLRAFRGVTGVEAEKAMVEIRKEYASYPNAEAQRSTSFDAYRAKSKGRTVGKAAIQDVVLRRFHVLVEPRVADSKTVLFADLEWEEKRLLLLALAGECLEDVDKLGGELPPPTQKALEQGYISAIVIGNKYLYPGKVPKEMENTCRFIYSLSLADKSGDTRKGGSYRIGNVTVPIPPDKAE